MKSSPLPQSPEFTLGRSIGGLLVGCFLLGASYAVSAYESRGARSCTAWLEYRQDKGVGFTRNADVYETWLIGYLSGVVAGSGMDFLAGTDNESVFRMVDVYCGQDPMANLATAGTSVARDLMLRKRIVNQGTLP